MTLRNEIESFLQANPSEIAEKFEEFLCLLGSASKACNFDANLTDNPSMDESHMNNFYYEREWRSIYEWNFKSEDVAMIIASTPEDIRILHDKIHQGVLKVQDTVPALSFDMIFKV